ncbi:hypothetical protein KIN20_032661 [Parelaphostrongylus tenuis]|uniref:Uncharacterized protein n=1 Tax=Parelaphostrongylus tenuis TaxID=148309 RepID=A0AAD5R7E2_PARTN|nr:hypothetical protein KIN20_032661 [Parelaphostrongylus tenuis]
MSKEKHHSRGKERSTGLPSENKLHKSKEHSKEKHKSKENSKDRSSSSSKKRSDSNSKTSHKAEVHSKQSRKSALGSEVNATSVAKENHKRSKSKEEKRSVDTPEKTAEITDNYEYVDDFEYEVRLQCHGQVHLVQSV